MQTERRRYEDGWHLDKRVNVGHILTTLALAGAIISMWMSMDRRVTTLEVRQDQSARTAQEIKGQLIEINRKMDRIMERMLDGQTANGVR